MSRFEERYGPYALVTGASSGLGAEFARQLAARGVGLVLVARSEAKMQTLAGEIKATHPVDVRVVAADLSAPDFLDVVLPAIEDVEIGLLVNNAGFTTTGPVLDTDSDASARMVDLNCRAPLLLTRALAPALRERGRGGVVVTASTMGFGGASGWATYNATKAFDLLFAEGLARELQPHGVDVVALCPGGTRTGFQAAGGIKEAAQMSWWMRLMIMDAPPVVRCGLESLGRRRIAVPGVMNKVMVWSMRFIPRRLNSWVLSQVVKQLAH